MDVTRLLADLSDIPHSTNVALLRQKSRDFFWYSPVLNRQLNGLSADAVISPRSEADVVRVAAACVKHRVPITARGGGTGNYGQAVPLHGGVVLDMTALDAIGWQKPGLIRVGAGRKLIDIDREARLNGWELRMHPSTKRTATIGGFVAGGSGGIGSATWGGLREPGNVAAARIVTMETEPRVLELREAETAAINHAYGTTGIITELEMPLAPAWPWVDIIVAFPTFMDAVRAGYDVALADGIVKKLLTPIAWPTPGAFRPIRSFCPDGAAILIAMIAEPSLLAFKSLLDRRHPAGEIMLERPTPDDVPLYEFTWNHTTLQVLKRDRTVTYLQTMHPHDRFLDSVAETETMFRGELDMHLEFLRVGGRVTASGVPIVHYSTDDRLFAIIEQHRAQGVSIADPHQVTLEDGAGHKRIDTDQLAFKHQADPLGLLNPGKMRGFVLAEGV